jgi:hypothetical protein
MHQSTWGITQLSVNDATSRVIRYKKEVPLTLLNQITKSNNSKQRQNQSKLFKPESIQMNQVETLPSVRAFSQQ